MITPHVLLFPPFRLDLAKDQLWHGNEEVRLRPKTFAVLRYLVAHADRVVSKDELLNAVWPDVYVSDVVPLVCIRELRAALGDNAKSPRFIQTMRGRGMRFIAPLDSIPPLQGTEDREQGSVRITPGEGDGYPFSRGPLLTLDPRPPSPVLVGRDAELALLQTQFQKALNGERQMLFVTGEPGIGKTTVLEAFARSIDGTNGLVTARGFCIEQYGGGEAYLPLLNVCGQLARGPRGRQFLAALHQHAPTWLLQLPSLVTTEELPALQKRAVGATPERMLREITEALEFFSLDTPLLVLLEDLHWSDYSTVELLSFIARRPEPARLCIVGTARPPRLSPTGPRLETVQRELLVHGQCRVLTLGLLEREDVTIYVEQRLARPASQRVSPRTIAHAVYERTEGNPLFMVTVMDHLLAQEELVPAEERLTDTAALEKVAGAVPETLRLFIEEQFQRLSPEQQQLLEVASVSGAKFSVAAVAAGADMGLADAEETCARFARGRQFIGADGVVAWPDGTVSTQYAFVHALYQEILYDRIPAGKRAQLHFRLGEQTELRYGKRAREIAAELAVHFERAQDYARALPHICSAAETSYWRVACQETLRHATKGLAWIAKVPASAETEKRELLLQMLLAHTLTTLSGYHTPAIKTAYQRGGVLSQRQGDTTSLLWTLIGQHSFHTMRADLAEMRAIGEETLRLAHTTADPTILLAARSMLGTTTYCHGDVAGAWQHFEHEVTLSDTQRRFEARIPFLCGRAQILAVLGYADQATRAMHQAITVAHEIAPPFLFAYGLTEAATLHLDLFALHDAHEYAEKAVRLSTNYGFSPWLGGGMAVRGSLLVMQGQHAEGIQQIADGFSLYQATGAMLQRPYLLELLAEALLRDNQHEAALRSLDEAFSIVRDKGLRFHEPRLWLLKGDILLGKEERSQKAKGKGQKAKVPNPQSQTLNPQSQADAEACFVHALESAHQQQAKMLELRAATSLARLWRRHGKTTEAHQVLFTVYNGFTEGFATKDLQEARALIAELSQ